MLINSLNSHQIQKQPMQKQSSSSSKKRQDSGLQNLSICFFQGQIKQAAIDNEIQKAYRLKNQVKELMDYRLNTSQSKNIHQNQGVQNQDVLRLMGMICGGYVQDDFSNYLSYHDFQQKKEEFDILNNIYSNTQKKYKNKKIQQSKIQFRSLLLMIYLQQSISKMSRVKIEQLFTKHKIVW